MNIKRDFFKDVYTILSRDLINNMDHMHISGSEPSSVILSQTKKIENRKRLPQSALTCSALTTRLEGMM